MRFGCCERQEAARVVEARDRHTVNPAGHRVRFLALGSVPPESGRRRHRVVLLRDVLAFLRRFLRNHWDVQLRRHDAVIHLRTPGQHDRYNHQNPLRLESAAQASLVDQRLIDVWARHPRRFIVEPAPDFLAKAKRVLDILRAQLPECCHQHPVPDVDGTIGKNHVARL